MGRITAAVTVALTLIACGRSTATFEDTVKEGASCAELYEIRNAAEPDDPRIPVWNEQLREIGCFSSTSTRTD